MAINPHVSEKMRSLLAQRNLDIDDAITKLRIQDHELKGKNSLEIAETVMRKAKTIGGNENELTQLILKVSLKDLAPTDEELAKEYNSSERWR
jgi:hypothetical protein